jgi:hypothetical protein
LHDRIRVPRLPGRFRQGDWLCFQLHTSNSTLQTSSELASFRTSHFTPQTSNLSGIGFVWRICPAPRVRFPGHPRAPRFGFVCSRWHLSSLLNTPNWVCLYNRPTLLAPRSPAHVASARIGFVSRDRPLPGAPSLRCPILPKFGFVSHISPSAPPADWRNWLCSAELPCGHHVGHLKLGLFVQPAPPALAAGRRSF